MLHKSKEIMQRVHVMLDEKDKTIKRKPEKHRTLIAEITKTLVHQG